VKWIELALDRAEWHAVVERFLTGLIISGLRKILYHGVSIGLL
jgi:hypothetical protein